MQIEKKKIEKCQKLQNVSQMYLFKENKLDLQRLSNEEPQRTTNTEYKFWSDQQIKDPLFSNSHNLI